MTLLYELRNIRKTFAGRDVLRIDGMRIFPGRIYALLGPNGAGKTTLMKGLAFLEPFSAGEVVFQGTLATAANTAVLRSHVVWVPQVPILFTGSLQYNVEYPLALRNVPKAERTRIARELLESVGLSHVAHSAAQSLSGGEAMRGSIARALATGAEVLLLDEPTASVDRVAKGELATLIREVWQARGLSILITTHDHALADSLCQEQIVLEDGCVAGRE